jgi:prepilin-type processing-associated H-X9-DG protein
MSKLTRLGACAALAAMVLGLSMPAVSQDAPKPSDEPSPEIVAKVEKLIGDFASDDFETRDKASKELMAIGIPALPVLEKAKDAKDPEVAPRISQAIEGIKKAFAEKMDGAEPLTIAQIETALKSLTGKPLYKAVRAIFVHKAADAEPILKKMISDKDPILRGLGVKGVRTCDAKALRGDIENLKDDASVWVKSQVAETLLVLDGGKKKAKPTSRKKRDCTLNLKQLGIAIIMFEDKFREYPRGTGPDIAAEMAEKISEIASPGLFVCKCADDVTSIDLLKAGIPESSSYIFTSKQIDDTMSANEPIVWDKPENHEGDDINVLFFDGHVELCQKGSGMYEQLVGEKKDK